MKDNFEIFSENLKILRKFYNMKQEDLAEKCEIPRTTLSYYETMKSEPTLTPLINISKVYSVYIDDLVNVKFTNEILKEKIINKNISSNRTFVSSTIFSKNLKAARLEKNLNQKECADKIGIGASNISFYETSQREPTLSTLLKIAKFFNRTIDDLVSEEINIIKFTHDEIEFFNKINFNYQSINSDSDKDFLTLLYNLKKFYIKQSEKLNDLIKIQIPAKIKEIDEIIDFIKNK